MRVMARLFIFNMFPISSHKTSLAPSARRAEVESALVSCSSEGHFDQEPGADGHWECARFIEVTRETLIPVAFAPP